MKRLEVLSIACALLSGACSFAFGELTFQELGKGSDHRIVVANDLLEVQFEPRRGGGIRHLIGKTDGFDRVHSQNRFLLDMFMRQPYPGEMQEANYEFEIIDERPRRVGVRMRRTAAVSPHDGIRLFKTVWINSGSRSLTAAYQFLNASAAYRSFSYWTQHFAVAGESEVNDRYVRPATDRLDVVPFPGGDRYLDVVERPAAGWTAVIDPLESIGTAFVLDFNYLRWLYNAFSASTVEWFTDQITIGPGQSWTTEFFIIPFSGFDSLAFASDRLLADSVVDRRDGGLRVRHRLMAVNEPILDLTIHAAALSTDGVASDGSLSVGVIGPEPVELEQHIPFENATNQMVLTILLGVGGEFGTYFVNLPDGEGKTGRLADLRPAPGKVKQYPDRPDDLGIRRNGRLDVLLLAGPGSKRFQIDRIRELDRPGEVEWSWYNSRVIMNARSHGVDYFPADYHELTGFDAIILSALGPYVLEDFSKNMLREYMDVGGRVLVLGGADAMNGWTGAGNPLAEIFPVRDPAPFRIRPVSPSSPMATTVPRLEDLFSESSPVVHFAHAMEPASGVKTTLRMGAEPLLVERRVGDGKLMVFLGTAFGPDSADAFWNWEQWPQLLERVLLD